MRSFRRSAAADQAGQTADPGEIHEIAPSSRVLGFPDHPRLRPSFADQPPLLCQTHTRDGEGLVSLQGAFDRDFVCFRFLADIFGREQRQVIDLDGLGTRDRLELPAKSVGTIEIRIRQFGQDLIFELSDPALGTPPALLERPEVFVAYDLDLRVVAGDALFQLVESFARSMAFFVSISRNFCARSSTRFGLRLSEGCAL
jgi:hypothetical protein